MRGSEVTRVWASNPTIYAPAQYRKACSYNAFVPYPVHGMALALDAREAGVVSDAEAAIKELNAVAQPALVPLARLLLRTESIASSKVEGLQLDIDDLARAEARELSGGQVSGTALEVLNNIDAMQLAVEEVSSGATFDLDHITAIHACLMEGAPNSHIAGRIRETQNWIGGNDHNPCGADFVPPPPEEVAGLLADLCAFVRDDSLPPLVQAAIAHAQFETIHPFDDGNGRTGRALVQIILRRRGIAPSYVPPISVILAGDREAYIRGLTKYRSDLVSQWCEQFAIAAARAAKLASAYLTALEHLAEEWRRRFREAFAPRADSAGWTIIDQLPAYPVLNAAVAVAATNRGRAAVYRALEELEQAGVLNPLTRGKRNRSWEAAGLLDLIENLEAGRLPGDRPRTA